MKHYKLVIFDWDGTVMDSIDRIVSAMRSAALDVGCDVPAKDAVRNIIGLSLPVAIETLFPKSDQAQVLALKDSYKHHYVNVDQTPTPIFDYAIELFQSLKQQGKELAVATGKARDGLERVWQETNTGVYFTSSRCAYECESKPHPQMLEQIMTELNVLPADTLMIGDTTYDLEMAQQAGVDSIGVTFGVHNEVQLKAFSPKAIISCYTELIKLLV